MKVKIEFFAQCILGIGIIDRYVNTLGITECSIVDQVGKRI